MSSRKQRERLAAKRAAYEAEMAQVKNAPKKRRKTPQTKKKTSQKEE